MPDDVKEPGKTETPVAKDAVVAASPKTSDIIDTWFRDHFAGTALGATTELYNAGHAAIADLKQRLSR